MKRGEIYFIGPAYQEEGANQKNDRPGIIVSNDTINEREDLVQVVYTTTSQVEDSQTHVTIRSGMRVSTAICERVSVVHRSRVGEKIAELTPDEIMMIDTGMAIALGITQNEKKVTVMREPTPEELDRMAKEHWEKQLRENPPKLVPVEPDAKTVKMKTERDLYKKFSEDLLEILKNKQVSTNES